MEYERDPRVGEPADRETPPPAEWLRLTKYLLGELDTEGCVEVEQWVAQKPVRAPVVALLRQAWRMPVGQEPPVDSTAALARVIEQIGQGQAIADVIANRPSLNGGVSAREQSAPSTLKESGVLGPQPLRRGAWYTLAGAITVAAIIVVGWRSGAVSLIQGKTASNSAYTTYVTANGERATIALPDGNTVALNVGSRLEVPMDYMTGNHTVHLSGEGLFTVSHHDGTPLTVTAGTTAARVLGTSFVMRRYPTDTTALVVVKEGKVAVGTTVVTANQLVEVDRANVPRVRPANASFFTFATGVLTLDGVPLSAAVDELDRWYDVDIRIVGHQVAGRPLRGKFAAGTIGDLSEILEWFLDVRVVRNGRVLTLFPRR